MCRDNKLAHLNRCHQLLHIYTAWTMNFIWFTDEKLFTVSALSNSEVIKSGVSRARNSTISHALCASALSCWNV